MTVSASGAFVEFSFRKGLPATRLRCTESRKETQTYDRTANASGNQISPLVFTREPVYGLGRFGAGVLGVMGQQTWNGNMIVQSGSCH